MQVVFNGQKIDFLFKRLRRSRALRISVKKGGEVTVTAPFFILAKQAEKFLIQNGEWVLDKMKLQQDKAAASKFPSGKKDFLLNKSKALHLVRDKIFKLNAIYNFKHGKVSIKNMSSRWGSCSKTGNLNFNYKLVYLSDEQAEYVVAHELSHLKEMNHGKKFWALVALTTPHWQTLRKQIKSIN